MAFLLCQILFLVYCVPFNEAHNTLLLGKPMAVSGFPKYPQGTIRQKQTTFKNQMVLYVSSIQDQKNGPQAIDATNSVFSLSGHSNLIPSDDIPWAATHVCGGYKGDAGTFRECLATYAWTEYGNVAHEAVNPYFSGGDEGVGLEYIAKTIHADRRAAFKYFMRALWDATHRNGRGIAINRVIEAQTKEWISEDSKGRLKHHVEHSRNPKVSTYQAFPPDYEIFGDTNSVKSSLSNDKLVLWRGFTDVIMLPGDPVANAGDQSKYLHGPSSWTPDLRVAIEFATRRGISSGTVMRVEIPKDRSGMSQPDKNKFGFLDIVKEGYLTKYHEYQKEMLLWNVPKVWLSVEQCVDAYISDEASLQARITDKCKRERYRRTQGGANAHAEPYDVIDNDGRKYKHTLLQRLKQMHSKV